MLCKELSLFACGYNIALAWTLAVVERGKVNVDTYHLPTARTGDDKATVFVRIWIGIFWQLEQVFSSVDTLGASLPLAMLYSDGVDSPHSSASCLSDTPFVCAISLILYSII